MTWLENRGMDGRSLKGSDFILKETFFVELGTIYFLTIVIYDFIGLDQN